jgi:hypothetical protein
MHTYRTDDGTYDVSKLSPEGQGLFSLLQHTLVEQSRAQNDAQAYQAAGSKLKELFEEELTDEALVEEDTEEENSTD